MAIIGPGLLDVQPNKFEILTQNGVFTIFALDRFCFLSGKCHPRRENIQYIFRTAAIYHTLYYLSLLGSPSGQRK